jgi:hypothetical protein
VPPVAPIARESRSGMRVADARAAEDGKMAKQSDRSGEMNLGGVLRSLGGFVDLVSKLAEQGEIQRTGEFDTKSDGMRAVYGISVRLGGTGTPHLEPFGNVKVSEKGPSVGRSASRSSTCSTRRITSW